MKLLRSLRPFLMGLAFVSFALAHASKQGCLNLLKKIVQDAPSRLTSVEKDPQVQDLPPVVRRPSSILWTLNASEIDVETLNAKLQKLFTHILNLSLSNSKSHVDLLHDRPEYRDYLEGVKEYIHHFLEAWYNPKSQRFEFGDQSILTTLYAQPYQKLAVQEIEKHKPAIEVSKQDLMFENRYVIPKIKVANHLLNWSARIVPNANNAQEFHVVVEGARSDSSFLNKNPEPIPGERQLRTYGSLSSLFGSAPKEFPGYHFKIFSAEPSKKHIRLSRVVDALEQATTEAKGSFDREAFLQKIAHSFNRQTAHLFCEHSVICDELSQDFITVAKKLLGKNADRYLKQNSDGFYYYDENLEVFDFIFSKVSLASVRDSEDGVRVMGWKAFKEFSMWAFENYDDTDWVETVSKFQLTDNFYKKTDLLFSSDMPLRFAGDDHFFADRAKFDLLRAKIVYDFGLFSQKARVEDVQLRSFSLGMEPSPHAIALGDLEEAHFRVFIQRLDHLLDINSSSQ